jgi:hypothetical protein
MPRRLASLLSAALLVGLAMAARAGPALANDVERRERQSLRAGAPAVVELDIELPPGWKLNPGAPLAYRLTADAVRLAIEETASHGVVTPPQVPVVVAMSAGAPGETLLTVGLTFAYCRDDERGVCILGAVTIEQPLALRPESTSSRVRVSYRAPRPPAQFR